jgi:hypothetical protein
MGPFALLRLTANQKRERLASSIDLSIPFCQLCLGT